MKKTVLKTSLDHLPARYQQDLLAIKEVILKCLPAEMIILFGSYARGNYVEDTYKEDDITYEYTSDYDILVVTQHEIDTINERWRRLNDRLKRRPTPIPTMPINHSIAFLNEKIRHNYYFFVDIIKEGIALYDSGKYDLAAPEKLKPKKKLEKAQEYFKYWFEKAEDFYDHFSFDIQKERYSLAAFMLHQAVENYYNTLSLVFTDYKPKTHDLDELRTRAIKINATIQGIFPKKTKEEKRIFELLRRAYVDARYNKNYKITSEELRYLDVQTLLLRELVENYSQLNIEKLKQLSNELGGV